MTDTLIERLDATTEGSRELDALVGKAIGYAGLGDVSDERAVKAVAYADAENILTIGEVTTSIDAALTLMPEEHSCWIKIVVERGLAMVVPEGTKWLGSKIHAPTPALALCIAALKARESIK